MSARVKPRIFVLTDIDNEPDDTQSLVRLLLYSNELDIEGLVATTSVHMQDKVFPELIHRVLAAYQQVEQNLRLHSDSYPSAEHLAQLVSSGQPGYGMASVGDGKDSDGSRKLAAAIEHEDNRPLWVAVWGGPNTLAQALYRFSKEKSDAEMADLISRIRVYAISDQDDSAHWIRRQFPQLFYVVSPGGYGAGAWTAINCFVEGIDNSSVSNEWLAENIQQGHGPLGAIYPDVAYGMEGDTPSFLGLIPNGVNDPEHPDWGGWGGRYELCVPERSLTDPDGFTGGVPVPQETRPIWTNACDTYQQRTTRSYGQAVRSDEQIHSDFRVPIWRWRDEFQNDFAARMDWTIHPYSSSNHPPIVQLGHPDRLTLRSGESAVLDASPSCDPDGDSLSFLWMHYKEAGTCKEDIAMWGAENLWKRGFTAPTVEKEETAHFIVKVTDKGTPPLTRYARVIVTILPFDQLSSE